MYHVTYDAYECVWFYYVVWQQAAFLWPWIERAVTSDFGLSLAGYAFN